MKWPVLLVLAIPSLANAQCRDWGMLHARLDAIEGRMAAVESRVSQTESRLSRIESYLSSGGYQPQPVAQSGSNWRCSYQIVSWQNRPWVVARCWTAAPLPFP